MPRDYCVTRDRKVIQEGRNGLDRMSKKSRGQASILASGMTETRVSENLFPSLSSSQEEASFSGSVYGI